MEKHSNRPNVRKQIKTKNRVECHPHMQNIEYKIYIVDGTTINDETKCMGTNFVNDSSAHINNTRLIRLYQVSI